MLEGCNSPLSLSILRVGDLCREPAGDEGPSPQGGEQDDDATARGIRAEDRRHLPIVQDEERVGHGGQVRERE